MSRCFSYPPSGYSLSNDRNLALIESIKLQKEKEKARAESKKEKKREKKMKKERKDKSKLNETGSFHEEKPYKDTNYLDKKEQKGEQLERSCLTEERQPQWFQNPSNSSDSTENSNKRKRDSASPNRCHVYGNIIRIKLPLRKENDVLVARGQLSSAPLHMLKENDVPVSRDGIFSAPHHNFKENDVAVTRGDVCSTSLQNTNERDVLVARGGVRSTPLLKHGDYDLPVGRADSVCSTSGRAELPVEQESRLSPVKNSLDRVTVEPYPTGAASGACREGVSPKLPGTGHTVKENPTKYEKSPSCPPVKTTEAQCQDVMEIFVKMTRTEKKMHKMASKYKDLIEKWVPPAPQTSLPVVDDDQDWLFGEKNQEGPPEKRLKATNEVQRCGPSTLLPCAQFLPEADIYSLPYTVPF